MSTKVSDKGIDHNDVSRSLWGTPGWKLEDRQENEVITVTATFITEFEPRVMGIHFHVKGVKVVDVKIHNHYGDVLTSMVFIESL